MANTVGGRGERESGAPAPGARAGGRKPPGPQDFDPPPKCRKWKKVRFRPYENRRKNHQPVRICGNRLLIIRYFCPQVPFLSEAEGSGAVAQPALSGARLQARQRVVYGTAENGIGKHRCNMPQL